MHKTDGSNHVSGLFKDSPTPGTTVERHWLNAVQQELVNLIEASGQTLLATGAADAAVVPTPWVQLLAAVRRISKSHGTAIVVPMNGDNQVPCNIVLGTHNYEITVGTGDLVGCEVGFTSNSASAFVGMEVVLLNTTVSYKRVTTYEGRKHRIDPGHMSKFIARQSVLGPPGDVEWHLVGAPMERRGSFIAEVRASVGGVLKSPTIRWAVRDGRCYMDINPSLLTNIAGTQQITITAEVNDPFPAELDCLFSGINFHIPFPCITGSGYALCVLVFTGAAGSRKMQVINTYGGGYSYDFLTSFQLLGGSFSFPLLTP